MGDVLFPRVVRKTTTPFHVAQTFADNTWETIIKACQNNRVPDSWAVGDQKTMTINGVGYVIDIIGKNHDDYSDGSGKAPLTFQLHDCVPTTYQMNSSNTNSGSWENSGIRNTHLPAFFATMPIEVQAAIKEVNKLTSAGEQRSTIVTTADKLFLLSEIEVIGSTTYSYGGEGSRYAYYVTGVEAKRVNGSINYWWTRSPERQATASFCMISGLGTSHNGNAINDYGVSFAFCF